MSYENYFTLRGETLDEESRVRYRSEIQRALAEIEVQKMRLGELQSVVNAVSADSDRAADEHSATCLPLQAELAQLDKQNIDAILARMVVPQEITSRRVEILQLISDENTRLEMRTAANRKTVSDLQADINRTRMETVSQSALETALQNLASPELRDSHACVADRLLWAQRRRDHARRFVSDNQQYITSERANQFCDERHIRTYQARITGHQKMVDDAEREIRTLNHEVAVLRDRMLSE